MKTFDWDFSAPASTPIGDHDVVAVSGHLRGHRIALLVCGGIAAMKAPMLARALRRRGADVVAFCSDEALRYVGREALEWSTCHPVVTALTWRAEHLSDGEGFSAYLVAPATYNTIGKAASCIADTVVSAALASALGRMQQGRTQVLFAPTMHGTMHHALLVDACQRLAALGARFITPRDAWGKHNLPDEELVVAAVCRALSRSPLRSAPLLVTGGLTPVPSDGVRRIVDRCQGHLGAAIHEELLLRGANATFLLGDSGWRPASWLPVEVVPTFDAYRDAVLRHVAAGQRAGIFAAGADSTENVIEHARTADPRLFLVGFQHGEGFDPEALVSAARERLDRYPVVVANDAEGSNGNGQVAYLVTRGGERRVEGRTELASAIADLLETDLPKA